jgi:hypothetical protein
LKAMLRMPRALEVAVRQRDVANKEDWASQNARRELRALVIKQAQGMAGVVVEPWVRTISGPA